MRFLAASLAGVLALSLASLAALALDFPALTGRVVDQAGVIGPVRTDVATKSKDLEERSTIQLVVATVPTLQGSSIEAYATQLFNTWRLGGADKNNGVLLLVAPNERKVRIEVGYGLERRLTDEICALILQDDVLPHFRKGDFAGGVTQGVERIIRVLEADKGEWQPLSPEQTTR